MTKVFDYVPARSGPMSAPAGAPTTAAVTGRRWLSAWHCRLLRRFAPAMQECGAHGFRTIFALKRVCLKPPPRGAYAEMSAVPSTFLRTPVGLPSGSPTDPRESRGPYPSLRKGLSVELITAADITDSRCSSQHTPCRPAVDIGLDRAQPAASRSWCITRFSVAESRPRPGSNVHHHLATPRRLRSAPSRDAVAAPSTLIREREERHRSRTLGYCAAGGKFSTNATLREKRARRRPER